MLPSTINLLINLFIFIIILILIYSLILMIGGKKLFKKSGKNESGALIPILNLFTALEIADMSTFYGILLFFPITNIFILFVMMYKIGKSFNVKFLFKIGLIIFPFIFYPLLSFSDKQYKIKDQEYFKVLDNAKTDNSNLLMSEEEIRSQIFEDEPKEDIDSIFKSNLELIEDAESYKAVKVNDDIIGKINDFSYEQDNNEINNSSNKLHDQINNEDNIEILDL